MSKMNKRKPTREKSPINQKDYDLPPEGLTDQKRKTCLDAFTAYIETQKDHCLGYQADQKMDYLQDTHQFLNCHVNNVGDPFTPGNYTVNSKAMEKAVLDYYAKLWNAKLPHDQKNPESYWGYVLTMGSTEGNLYGLWTARDYLAGKKLIVDTAQNNKLKSSQHKRNTRSPLPKPHDNEHAYTPVAFFSQDTHYSIVKAMSVMQIPMYDEAAMKYLPGEKNPITPDGEWSSSEVPSKDGSSGPGSIDIDALVILVEFFASRGFPILIVCNYGSTFKGAYDDVNTIGERLMPIFKKYGLVDRKVEYDHEKHLFDIRNGYWIHVDGALGASYMPFVKMAKDKGIQDIPICGPEFDFGLKCVNSLVMSGHKWPGAPWPCGIYMTKVKYQLYPPDDPEYIGSPDSTFAGSRNGFSSIILWDYLAKHSYEDQIDRIRRCEYLAGYAETQLKTVEPCHPELKLWIERTPLSLTVRFHKPNDWIVFKYSLSCETLSVDGEKRNYAHIFAMDSASEELIDALVEDLKQPDAFKDVKDEPISDQRARGWR